MGEIKPPSRTELADYMRRSHADHVGMTDCWENVADDVLSVMEDTGEVLSLREDVTRLKAEVAAKSAAYRQACEEIRSWRQSEDALKERIAEHYIPALDKAQIQISKLEMLVKMDALTKASEKIQELKLEVGDLQAKRAAEAQATRLAIRNYTKLSEDYDALSADSGRLQDAVNAIPDIERLAEERHAETVRDFAAALLDVLDDWAAMIPQSLKAILPAGPVADRILDPVGHSEAVKLHARVIEHARRIWHERDTAGGRRMRTP